MFDSKLKESKIGFKNLHTNQEEDRNTFETINHFVPDRLAFLCTSIVEIITERVLKKHKLAHQAWQNHVSLPQWYKEPHAVWFISWSSQSDSLNLAYVISLFLFMFAEILCIIPMQYTRGRLIYDQFYL